MEIDWNLASNAVFERSLGDEFEQICPGRRLVLEYPVAESMKILAVILDSEKAATVDDELVTDCAAILVPRGKESDWVYSSKGGQWQLLASAGVKRLILLSLISEAKGRRAKAKWARRFTREETGRRGLKITQECTAKREQTAGVSREGGNEPSRDIDEIGAAQEGESRPVRRTGETSPQSDLTETKETKIRKPVLDRPSGGKRRHDNDRDRRLRTDEGQQRDGSREHDVQWSVKSEDEALKASLGPLVLALAPKSCFNAGVPNVPFFSYTDNVLQRLVVEEAFSTLTGLMRVEDVELETESNETLELVYPRDTSRKGLRIEEGIGMVKRSTKSWRRRLVFRRMPNLIQTEVLLISSHLLDGRNASDKGKNNWDKKGREKYKRCRRHHREGQLGFSNLEKTVRRVDNSRLVHKYLPPIVAGFVLVTSCLDACVTSNGRRPRVLSIGVGGGALPIFLQKHFDFHIQVVDLDEEVLQLARRHFGLKEDDFFRVIVGDGLAVVEEVASRAIKEGFVDDQYGYSWTRSHSHSSSCHFSLRKDAPSKGSSSGLQGVECGCWLNENKAHLVDEPRKSSASLNSDSLRGQVDASLSSNMSHFTCPGGYGKDPRVEVIIVDVDVGDARLGLSSPPLPFLEHRFLLSARRALSKGGMLVMNVVPCGNKPYEGVIDSIKAVFAEVYEIALKDDLNHIVFALPNPACDNNQQRKGHTLHQVKRVVGDQFIQVIRRMK